MRGGMGDYTRELGIALAQQGWDVHIITHIAAQQAPQDSRVRQHLTVHPLIHHWNWQGLFHLTRHLSRMAPGILHIQYQTAAYGLHPAINLLPHWARHRLPHLRTAITYHDLREPYLFPKAGPLRGWITYLPARASDLVIATNREDERRLREHGLTPWRIPIGPNVHPVVLPREAVEQARIRWGIPPDAAVIGYFGFLNRSKGVTELLLAAARLVEEGVNVHVLMMGEPVGASDPTNRAYMEEVTDLIVTQGLEDRVHWTGYIDDAELSAGFALVQVVVLPYRDGVSLRRGTLHAALAHGVPIITTEPRHPIPELEGALWTVPPGDVDALAAAVQRLLEDADARQELARRAKEVAQHFTWERIAEQHTRAYHQILGATPNANLGQ
ncbi:MAG: glycosyltransferase [Chloroflexi bacterium]|nr:glycosyltransferase [Chloroflexota bacterium]